MFSPLVAAAAAPTSGRLHVGHPDAPCVASAPFQALASVAEPFGALLLLSLPLQFSLLHSVCQSGPPEPAALASLNTMVDWVPGMWEPCCSHCWHWALSEQFNQSNYGLLASNYTSLTQSSKPVSTLTTVHDFKWKYSYFRDHKGLLPWHAAAPKPVSRTPPASNSIDVHWFAVSAVWACANSDSIICLLVTILSVKKEKEGSKSSIISLWCTVVCVMVLLWTALC